MNENVDKKETQSSLYCPVCESCGEDGCCSALNCMHTPNGYYCETYLNELKFGYKMYHQLIKLVEDDERYKKLIDKIWNDTYDDQFKN